MRLYKVLRQVVAMAQPIVKKLEVRGQVWTKPATENLIRGTAANLMKSKPELVAENVLLRQQMRQVACPQ